LALVARPSPPHPKSFSAPEGQRRTSGSPYLSLSLARRDAIFAA
jgi:hypothetical protein